MITNLRSVSSRIFSIGLAFAAVVYDAPASAAVIPVGATIASDLIVNFNFTGSTPAPTYSQVESLFTITGLAVGSTLTVDRFADLNGANVNIPNFNVIVGTGGSQTIDNPSMNATVLDGLYSFGFRVDTGTASLDSFIATATAASGGATVTINGVLVPAASAVPEPVSIALLGTGLVGLMVSRRSRKR